MAAKACGTLSAIKESDVAKLIISKEELCLPRIRKLDKRKKKDNSLIDDR